MSARTFKPTNCDCCGKQYGKRERVASMRFRPDGAPFEVSYTVCMPCHPKIGTDIDATNACLTNVMQRVPELLAYANTGGLA